MARESRATEATTAVTRGGKQADATAVGIGWKHRQEEEVTAMATEGRMVEATAETRGGAPADATAVGT